MYQNVSECMLSILPYTLRDTLGSPNPEAMPHGLIAPLKVLTTYIISYGDYRPVRQKNEFIIIVT
jgi:hypothetical protein